MRVTANGKVWRCAAEWRMMCERFAQRGLGSPNCVPGSSWR
jgi:hypothetical protein